MEKETAATIQLILMEESARWQFMYSHLNSSWYKDYGYPKLQQKHNRNAVDVIEEMKTIVQKFLAWK